MLTEYEAWKLQRDLRHDLGTWRRLDVRSRLLLVVVLALIGF